MKFLLTLFLAAALLGAWIWHASSGRGNQHVLEDLAPSGVLAEDLAPSGVALSGVLREEHSSTPEERELPSEQRRPVTQTPPAAEDPLANSVPRPTPGDFDGPLVEDFYANGQRLSLAHQVQDSLGIWRLDGAWTCWYENGQMMERGSYSKSEESGPWEWWDTNGTKVAVGQFVQGKREGPWTFWYSNGIKQSDANYAQGVGAGPWTLYYDDGTRCAQGSFFDGKIGGYWTIWDEFGAVNHDRTGHYEEGKLVVQ